MRGLEIFEEEPAFEQALAELEQRAELDRERYEGVAVEVDAAEGGPLHQYALARRGDAIEQLMVLAKVDPNDAIAVASAQATIRDYLRVAKWARGVVDAGNQAEKTLKEDYSNDGQHHED